MRQKQLAQTAFALGMIGLGIVGLVYGDFAQVWHFVPDSIPGRQVMAYASAIIVKHPLFGCRAKSFQAIAHDD